jgi:hypothetical protein
MYKARLANCGASKSRIPFQPSNMARWRALPEDVLEEIMRYLQPRDVETLATMDPFFLRLVLPKRYRLVALNSYTPRTRWLLCERLRCASVCVSFIRSRLNESISGQKIAHHPAGT